MAATKSRSSRSQSSRSGSQARGGASRGQGSKRGQTQKRTTSGSSQKRTTSGSSQKRTTRGSSQKRTTRGSSQSRSRSSNSSAKNSRSRSSSSSAKNGGGADRAKTAPKDGGPNGLARIASKAKGPALAGGAALVGLAGGAALSRGKRRNGLRGRMSNLGSSLKPPKPNMKRAKQLPSKLPSRDEAVRTVSNVAGEVARRSGRVGQIASEVQKATEAIDSRSKEKD